MFIPARFQGGPNFPYRVGLTANGDIEAAAPNPDYPRTPFRVVIDSRTGNLVESSVLIDSDKFARLIRAARQYVRL